MFLFILRSDTGQTVVAEIDHQVNKQTISVILQQLISSIELILHQAMNFILSTITFICMGVALIHLTLTHSLQNMSLPTKVFISGFLFISI